MRRDLFSQVIQNLPTMEKQDSRFHIWWENWIRRRNEKAYKRSYIPINNIILNE